MDHLRRFFRELRRRHVYQVAAVYAVVAWVVIQIAETALPYLTSDADWRIRAVNIMAPAGFPVALILGRLFDVTPEGMRRTDASVMGGEAPGGAAEATGEGRSAARPGTERRAGPAQPSPGRVAAIVDLLAIAVGIGLPRRA